VGITGSIHGGQQPIAGAHVYLLAAGTSGYGSASTSLLTSGIDGSDPLGGYVLSQSDGSFGIGGAYSCTPNTQVYLYALGGDPGAGSNSVVGLMAVLGNCPGTGNFASATPFVPIKEVSTVAAAYAFSAFAVDATDVGSSNTALAQTGIANAFANTTNLVNLANGTVPQAEINTLANILAECINSTGSASIPCSALFSNAMSAGSSGTAPTDTATTPANTNYPESIAIDHIGNLWVANFGGSSFNELTYTGAYTGTFTGGGLNRPFQTISDAGGNLWSPDPNNGRVALFHNGIPDPSSPFTATGLAPHSEPRWQPSTHSATSG
jgi:hypothetical protein